MPRLVLFQIEKPPTGRWQFCIGVRYPDGRQSMATSHSPWTALRMLLRGRA